MSSDERSPKDNTWDLGKIMMIGDQPYRTGFLQAFWGRSLLHGARGKIIAGRRNVLSGWENLYHYTSIAGLKGIIEENGFWASDNRFMNDAQESHDGIKIALNILTRKRQRTSSEEFKRILDNVAAKISEPKDYGQLVACFSSARDDLGQWRGYGAGGVCLRLGTNSEGESPLFFGPEHMPHQAIYSDRRKNVIILNIVGDYEREYVEDRRVMSSFWHNEHDAHYEEHMITSISSYILGFKNASFLNEREARIVLSYKDINRYDGGLRFRANSLGIVPYLRTGDHLAIKADGGRLPLKEVIIGPSPNQDLVLESVKTYLKYKKYGATIVTASNVPYRAS